MKQLVKIYDLLLREYGTQGWWPIMKNSEAVYSKAMIEKKKSDHEIWEISLGAVLTQNTSWDSVVKSLKILQENDLLKMDKIAAVNPEILAPMIRSSRYMNQKSPRIVNLAKYYQQERICNLRKLSSEALRNKLLELKGIGPETADSILLYGFNYPQFIPDAYTRRLFSRLGFFESSISYEKAQDFFHENLRRDSKMFNEFHALIVRHCITNCLKKPNCEKCFLSDKKICIFKK